MGKVLNRVSCVTGFAWQKSRRDTGDAVQSIVRWLIDSSLIGLSHVRYTLACSCFRNVDERGKSFGMPLGWVFREWVKLIE